MTAIHQLQLGTHQILRRRQDLEVGKTGSGRMTSRGGRPSTSES